MDLDLVGYLFGSLDSADRRRVETALRNDPVTRRRLDRLRAALSPLNALRSADELPPGLAERTVAYVFAQTKPLVRDNRPTLARHVEVPTDQPVFQASRWRWADALVAACILIVLGGLGLSGFNRLKLRNELTACQDNLRQYHLALANYSDLHQGYFPQVQDQPPHNMAGTFVLMLKDAGTLPAAGVADCPAVVVVRAGTRSAVGYAYTLGYRDGQGRLHGLRRDADADENDVLPILSDLPGPSNHRGGHNVLFISGNVRFCTSSNVGVAGDNIFMNQADLVAPGLHRLDSVIAPGNTPP